MMARTEERPSDRELRLLERKRQGGGGLKPIKPMARRKASFVEKDYTGKVLRSELGDDGGTRILLGHHESGEITIQITPPR